MSFINNIRDRYIYNGYTFVRTEEDSSVTKMIFNKGEDFNCFIISSKISKNEITKYDGPNNTIVLNFKISLPKHPITNCPLFLAESFAINLLKTPHFGNAKVCDFPAKDSNTIFIDDIVVRYIEAKIGDVIRFETYRLNGQIIEKNYTYRVVTPRSVQSVQEEE